MTALAHILVATDFSASAGHAAERGAALAQAHGARLHLVHVLDDLRLHMATAAMSPHALDTEQRLVASGRSRLKDLADTLARRFAVPVEHELLLGRTHLQVARYAQAHAVDMAVFGAHGENAVRDLFVGSTASKFLRRGRQPTLVVRATGHQRYERVLVAVDFSDASALALAWATKLAPPAAVDVLHVCELAFEGKMRFAGIGDGLINDYRRQSQADASGQLNAFLAALPGTEAMSREVLTGPTAETIVARARARQADLVVIGKRGRLELDELLLGSVALRVLEETDRDLLLVAPAQAAD